MKLTHRVLGAAATMIAAAALAPAAMASSTPTETLDQSAGHQAGAFQNLGMDLTFANSPSTDSPDRLTIVLPPGLLANTAIDNGACLTTAASASPTAACEIGTGQVSASATVTTPGVLGLPGVSTVVPAPAQTVDFYLVKPPATGDLAGLEVYDPSIGEELGNPGDIDIRSTSDPLGVGATITLTVPNTLTIPGLGANLPISVSQIDSTFDQLRYPTTCPATPETVSGSVTSYGDATARPFSAPLPVTGCSSLPYAPAFSATAARDASDKNVALTTTITQSSSESPNRNVSLTFPTATFRPNTNALTNLCTGSTARCTPVGSVTAASPLYPTALTGSAYLTGTSRGLGLTLVFPSPFPLTLVGSVNLSTNTAAFTGLPDIPLTNLKVALNGGSTGLFFTTCQAPTGSATASVTDQNGDQTRALSTSLSVAGCPGVSTPGSTGTSGGGGTGGTGSGSGTSGSSLSPTSTAKVVSTSASGLAAGKPRLSFTVAVGRRASKLTRLTVELPKGLVLVRHRVHRKERIEGVSLKGGKVRSLGVSHGHLVITMRSGTRRVTVTMTDRSLRERRSLREQASRRTIKSLRLTVLARNAARRQKTIHVNVTKLGL